MVKCKEAKKPRKGLRVEPNITRIRITQKAIQEKAEENTAKVPTSTVGWSTDFLPLEIWM